MLKKIVVGVVVLIAIAAGIAWYLFSNLDSMVKAAIETYGTAAAQADVRVDKVSITIASGSATISGLSVANPRGFSDQHALELGSITATIDASSITGTGPIVIKQVDVERPQVTYEVDNSGASNLATIQKNATSYAGGRTPSGAAPANSQPRRKLVIDDLIIRQGRVGISASLLKGKSLTAPLPEIHMTNIGKSSGGATPGQVAGQVLAAISGAAAKVGSGELAKSMGASVSSAGSSVSGASQGVGSQIKGLFGK